jgi:sterol desaturase/sphingolipid hydroxylase (fatty acid hydroxylase superfamily)
MWSSSDAARVRMTKTAMSTASLRSRYRLDKIGAGYNGVRNVASNVAVCALLMLASATAMGRPTWTDGALLVLTTLLFNAVEYMFHRWLSHNKARRKTYRRHVTEHHGFFDHETMTSEHLADLHVTILPTRSIVEYYMLFLAFYLVPCAWLLGLKSAAAASLGVAANILLLDVLHYYYHMDEHLLLARILGRFGYFRALKEHHRIHHDRKIMTKCNFNITHPWCDILLGTRYKG